MLERQRQEEGMIIALYIAAAVIMVVGSLYFAWRNTDFRKFLAGAFFVSSGIMFYLYLADVSVPLLGTSFVETPQISGGRSIIIPSSSCSVSILASSGSQRLETDAIHVTQAVIALHGFRTHTRRDEGSPRASEVARRLGRPSAIGDSLGAALAQSGRAGLKQAGRAQAHASPRRLSSEANCVVRVPSAHHRTMPGADGTSSVKKRPRIRNGINTDFTHRPEHEMFKSHETRRSFCWA
jgi:hypothetical protein